MIINILQIVVVMVLAMLFHELGHYFYLKTNNYYAAIRFKKGNLVTEYFKNIPVQIKRNMIMAGITSGMVVITAGIIFNVSWISLILYLFVGCRTDLIKLYNLKKKI